MYIRRMGEQTLIRYFLVLMLFFSSIFFQGCRETIVFIQEDGNAFALTGSKTKASSGLLYHEDTGYLLEAFDDPFFAKEGDKVTHSAIEFYPKTIEEYYYLRDLPEDVLVDFIPFGYRPVRDVMLGESRSYPVFPRQKQYVVERRLKADISMDIQETIPADCFHGVLPEPSILPIIYAVWPEDKMLPEGIEYKDVGSICLPEEQFRADDQLRIPGQVVLPLAVDTYDALLNNYIPLAGIKIRISYGLAHADFFTDSTGTVRMRPLLTEALIDLSLNELEQAIVSIVFESPRWTISQGNSVTPIMHLLGTVSSLWGTMISGTTYPTYVSHRYSNTNEYEIHMAAQYYHHGAHGFSNYVSMSEFGTIIHSSSLSGNYAGITYFPNGKPDITIYDVFNGYQCFCIGTVLHELGHVHHHYQYNGSSSPSSLIRESYASYIGWLLGEKFYLDKGYIKPFANYHINTQHRQSWTPSSGSNYTPLFVDLADDYNQSAITDIIDGVPDSVINGMGSVVSSVADAYSFLSPYAGSLFSQTDLDINFFYY